MQYNRKYLQVHINLQQRLFGQQLIKTPQIGHLIQVPQRQPLLTISLKLFLLVVVDLVDFIGFVFEEAQEVVRDGFEVALGAVEEVVGHGVVG